MNAAAVYLGAWTETQEFAAEGGDWRRLAAAGFVWTCGGAMGFTGPMGSRQIWAKNHTTAQERNRKKWRRMLLDSPCLRLSPLAAVAVLPGQQHLKSVLWHLESEPQRSTAPDGGGRGGATTSRHRVIGTPPVVIFLQYSSIFEA